MRYADDAVLIAENKEDLPQLLDITKEESRRKGYGLKSKNTEVKNLQTIFKELKNQIHALQNFARRQKRLLSSSLETMLSCPMPFQEQQLQKHT